MIYSKVTGSAVISRYQTLSLFKGKHNGGKYYFKSYKSVILRVRVSVSSTKQECS